MTNREKFKMVFGKNIHWSSSIEPQILALKSAHIDGIDCMEEWLNAEYKEPINENDLENDYIQNDMLGLTVEQSKQLLEWARHLWVLLDQDDFNKIAEIFENAVNREEYYQEHEESEGKMLVCPACGLDVHKDYKTCPRCGTNIRGD